MKNTLELMKTTIYVIAFATMFFAVSAAAQETAKTVSMQPISAESFAVMREFFEYDRQIPLEARTVARQETPAYVREKIVFRSARDARVPGYLAIPKNGKAPYPVAILLHGIGSSKDSWWQDDSFQSGGLLTKNLLAAGIAVLTLDAEYHGERIAENDFESPSVFTLQKGWMMRARDMIVQTAIDHRRAIDYLASRDDIDGDRIGTIGYSMGGMTTVHLSAIEPRIKASAAIVPPIRGVAQTALALHNFATHSADAASFLLLAGKTDTMNYSEAEAKAFFETVKAKDKDFVVYDAGHQLPAEWTNRASNWMKEKLAKNSAEK